MIYFPLFYFILFFQAEDGIRDGRVTGVQTCALPILGAAKTLRPTNAPPSLEAQYRGLWKTCQEKFINKPQNLMLTVSKTSTYCGGYANGRTRRWMRKNTAGTKMKFGARKSCQPRRLPRSWREVVARRPISAKNCPFALDGTKQISVCQKRCAPRISRSCTHSPAESRW